MPVTKLSELMSIDKEELTVEVRSGKYLPQPILGVEIPKGNKGGTRLLGIPSVTDRMLQQAVLQVMMARFEFSESSFGFRPNKLKLTSNREKSGIRRPVNFTILEFGFVPA